MAITLAQAKLNTQDDYDTTVIDEFRKDSPLLDAMPFQQSVNPAGGGATLDYSYRRLVTQATAETRALYSEYSKQNVTTEKITGTLAEIGGAYEIDRRIAHLGSAATDEIALQTAQKIKAARARFNDEVVNGDTAVDADGFDGLDKALTGSSTEITGGKDWSAFVDAVSYLTVLDDLDELQSELDGPGTMLIANKAVLMKVRAAARRANLYTKSPVDGLTSPSGAPLTREMVGDLVLVEAGEKAGSNDPVIPVDSTGTTDIYIVRLGLDGFHGVTTAGGNIVRTKLPDFSTAGAVKTGEVYLENVGVALKATRAAAVLRSVKVR